MNPEVLSEVLDIMSRLFLIPVADLSAESSMDSVEQWDSLQHINVIVDIEQRFGISLTPEEVMSLNTVRALVAVVEAKTSVAKT